jgi:hypothetical protein
MRSICACMLEPPTNTEMQVMHMAAWRYIYDTKPCLHTTALMRRKTYPSTRSAWGSSYRELNAQRRIVTPQHSFENHKFRSAGSDGTITGCDHCYDNEDNVQVICVPTAVNVNTLWWTKWHWDRFFSELSVSPPVDFIPLVLH